MVNYIEFKSDLKLFVLRKQIQDDQPLPLLPPGMKTKFVSVTPPGTIHNR